MMRKCSPRFFLLFVVVVLSIVGSAGAVVAEERGDRGAVRFLEAVPIPGQMFVFDISWVDAKTQRYYLADRSNNAVDVIDARTDTFVKQINKGGFKGFTGDNGTSGPNGVVVSNPWLFVTDAPSRVVTIDLRIDAVVSDVSTGGANGFRADELAYDPKDGLLLVVNNADTPPFATLISVTKATGHLTVGARISFPTATNGAEQPVWDPGTRKFYLSIPEINGDGGSGPDGAVARIATDGTLETMFPVRFCQPAGLTLGPHEDLLLGCSVAFDTAGQAWSAADPNTAAPISVIMDARTGAIDRNVPGVSGSDEVWFNPGDGRFYLAARANPGGPVLGVIDAESQALVQVVPTLNVAAVKGVHPAGTAHSVAVNPHNNHVFVPLAANNVFPGCLTGCVAVFGTPDDED
jgi:hypothetical protein